MNIENFDQREDQFIRADFVCARYALLINKAEPAIRIAMLSAALLFGTAFQAGCGATCDRIEADRTRFLERTGKSTEIHVEVTIPFVVAQRLVEPHVAAVKPIDIAIPGLGNLSSYFGNLSVAPTRVELKAAAPDHLGFHMDFEVQRNGDKVFEIYLETEVRPEIDLAAGKIIIGFTPEALRNTKPGLSKDAKYHLSEMIYTQIPTLARMLIPRSAVDSVVDSAVERLIDGFYARAQEKLLPRLSEMSQLALALPNVPLASVAITSTEKNGGSLRLAMTTSLPVSKGVAQMPGGVAYASRQNVTIRTSGSVAAELVNWAMAKELLPSRYDDKGKPQKDGALRAGLDWIQGDARPMRIYLWDLNKPCMRLTMSAKPSIAVVGDNLEIKAEKIETDDVEASAFTKAGVWFSLLWKDAMNVNKKSSAKIKTIVAGKEVEAVVKRAVLERDELVMEVSLAVDASQAY